MSLSDSQRYNIKELNDLFNKALLNEEMHNKLYKSTDGILRILYTIYITKGENWASQVLDEEGNQVLTSDEQAKFTDIFQPYIEHILGFFDNHDIKHNDEMQGGQAGETPAGGIDNIYTSIIKHIENINSTVNNYAAKYGILKLEKEHDIDDDVQVIPKPIDSSVSEGVFGLSTAAGLPIVPPITMGVLSKIKVPFRTIVLTIYLILDIARLAIGITGPPAGRKIMSILLALLELLRGDWKKAVLSGIGYYGMIPMLMGQLLKAFLTLFRMLSPDIQNNIVFGSLDIGKSFIVGLLLSIFQVTAPAQIRQPLIESLNKIAERKAQMDETLETVGLPPRQDYLSPNWNDLNNIQAVMSDKVYICSCEGRQLVSTINKSPIIRTILEILRIPVNEDMITQKCGQGDCKDFATTIVKEGLEQKQEQEITPSLTTLVEEGSTQPSLPTTTPSLQQSVGVQPKEKSKGFMRRGLNEIGGIAQNSLLQTVQGGSIVSNKRIVRGASRIHSHPTIIKNKSNHTCFW